MIKNKTKNLLKIISSILITVSVAVLLPAALNAQAYISALEVRYTDPTAGSTDAPYYCSNKSTSATSIRSFIKGKMLSAKVSYYQSPTNVSGCPATAYDIDDPRGMCTQPAGSAARKVFDFWGTGTSVVYTNSASTSVYLKDVQPEVANLIWAANTQSTSAGRPAKFTCVISGGGTDCMGSIPAGQNITITYTTPDVYQGFSAGTYTQFPPMGGTMTAASIPATNSVFVGNNKNTMDMVNSLAYTYTGHPMQLTNDSGALRYTVEYVYDKLDTTNGTESATNDPFKMSSLIEFDLPHNYTYPNNNVGSYVYPNHCLELCVTVQCMPEAWGGKGTSDDPYFGTPTFPLQKITLEIFKFLGQVNPLNPDNTPAIRTIETYPDPTSMADSFCCGFAPCTEYKAGDSGVPTGCSGANDAGTGGNDKSCLNTSATGTALLTALRSQQKTVCVPWDGTYNFESEFAKTNGTFGFRGRVETNFQPPPMVSDTPVEIDNLAAFPGANQVPIQVDVTNVHTVRTTATVVGATGKVAAQPYNISYRLSKDAQVQMFVLDANVTDKTLLASSAVVPSADAKSFVTYPNEYTCTNATTMVAPNVNAASYCTSNPTYCAGLPKTGDVIRRKLLQGADKLGENAPEGGQLDGKAATVENEPFNGLDDTGKFLPPGNYLVSLQAKTTDEWGVDTSRLQEVQISLDPLKITDLAVGDLNKLSTAYAQLAFFLTEAATVNLEVHKPGTTFTTLYTPYDSTAPAAGYIGNRPLPQQSNTLVYKSTEQKVGRALTNMKWDGRCGLDKNPGAAAQGASGCAYKGEPMNDGDYVFVLWAEIPYKDKNGDPAKYLRGDCAVFDALRSVQYYTGRLPVDRGQVDITIQPVSYSTIGSSPTAYGLDPFMFKYSISREAPVTAAIKTTDGQVVVKKLVNEEVQVAQQMNVYSWNGIDDAGRYVSPGVYMFDVTTRDPLFPNDAEKVYKQSAIFPVDIFRVVDVADTPLVGTANARATISYTLAKSMDVDLVIFDKGVVIPVRKAPGNENNWTLANPANQWGMICSQNDIDTTSFSSLDCIYSPNITTGYPSSRQDPVRGTAIPAGLKPIKTFTSTVSGEGKRITENWDGYAETLRAVVPDGKYPYMIKATTKDAGHQYYEVDQNNNINTLNPPKLIDYANGAGTAIYATDKPTGFITVARGNVQFLDNTIKVSAENPALFHTTDVVYIPKYTIEFAVSRIAEVNIEIVSTETGGCGKGVVSNAGTVCRSVTKSVGSTTSSEYRVFEAVNVQRVFWDGKNEEGYYVKPGAFEVHFKANGYPVNTANIGPNKTYETTEIRLLNVNLYQVYDIWMADIEQRDQNAMFKYQVSLPFKVGIQIFKPGTTMDLVQTGNVTRVDLIDPATKKKASSDQEVLVRSIVGIRPERMELTEFWDGKDYAYQDVPDGIYPFRFVTATDAFNIDSVTGSITCPNPTAATQCQENVADWNAYTHFGYIMVARGDGQFVCEDWDNAQIFYPNPFRSNSGTFEITKIPVPGEYGLKIYNLAGDLVRTKGYPCVDRQNNTIMLNDTVRIEPDQSVSYYNNQQNNAQSDSYNIRNAELRCTWDKKNDHGKKVARGVYFAIADFKATHGGREHCQKVVKILIP